MVGIAVTEPIGERRAVPNDHIKRAVELEAKGVILNDLTACKIQVEEQITKWLELHKDETEAKYIVLQTQQTEMQAQLKEIQTLLEQGRGMFTALRWIVVVVGTLGALVVWLHDKISWAK